MALFGNRAVLLIPLLAGCSNIPSDPYETTREVLREGSFAAGIVSGSDGDEAAAVVERIERASGARAVVTHDTASALVDQLQQRQINVMIGAFAHDSPLKATVFFSAPVGNISVESDRPTMLVEEAVRAK